MPISTTTRAANALIPAGMAGRLVAIIGIKAKLTVSAKIRRTRGGT